MAGNNSQAGTNDAGLEPWRRFFDGADIFDVITHAILIAATDAPQEFQRRRDSIVEQIYSAPAIVPVQGTAAADEDPSSAARHVSAEDAAGNNNVAAADCVNNVEEMAAADERVAAASDNPHVPGAHGNDSTGAYAIDCLNMDGVSKEIQKGLWIKPVILNHQHEQPIDLFESLKWLEVMQLTVDTRKSIGIEDVVHALKKHKSFIIRMLVRDITKGRKVRVDGIAHKMPSSIQASTPSSSTPMVMQKIPIYFYEDVIQTTVTSSAQEVESFIREVQGDHRHHLVIGLDTEWRVVQEGGELRHRTALLQLCVDKHCLVFQTHHAAVIPDALKDFLTCPQCNFVGADVDGDIKRLSEDYKIKVPRWTDLQDMAKKSKGYKRKLSLKDMAQEMMDVTMNKDSIHTFWGEPELTPWQIEYAAIDAFVSSKLALLMDIKPFTEGCQ